MWIWGQSTRTIICSLHWDGTKGSACFEIKFFSIQADGTTDAGRIEDELFVVLFLDPHSEDGTLHVQSWLDVPSTALLMVGTGALKGAFPF